MRPAPDSGACGESGGGTRTRHTEIHPREEVRNRAPRESDVAPPPGAEAKFCAQRLTGGAKWGVVRGHPGKCSPAAPLWPPRIAGRRIICVHKCPASHQFFLLIKLGIEGK
ncbi:unnamed protein product [Rangifer tarandus platyrhynchus]|uniref:Uncharacterized protein n=1 Tax=Rangifer tarandus platyrhynchus TaxID=3082113 RepID=A0AC59Y0M9_RANTA